MLWDFLLTLTHTKPVQQTRTSLGSAITHLRYQTCCFHKGPVTAKQKRKKILKQVSHQRIRQRLPLYRCDCFSKFSLLRQRFLTTAKRKRSASAKTHCLRLFVSVDKKDEQFLVVLRTSYAIR